MANVTYSTIAVLDNLCSDNTMRGRGHNLQIPVWTENQSRKDGGGGYYHSNLTIRGGAVEQADLEEFNLPIKGRILLRDGRRGRTQRPRCVSRARDAPVTFSKLDLTRFRSASCDVAGFHR